MHDLLRKAREEEAAATPGPWEQRGAFIDSIFGPPVIAETDRYDDSNGALIAHARNDRSLMLDVVDRTAWRLSYHTLSPDSNDRPFCHKCGADWPCEPELRAALDALRAEWEETYR
jgi:hypothetical protein